MPIGELILTSISNKNLYLSKNPKITFFKSIYKKYNNFSIETIPQYFVNKPDFGKKFTINLSKNADLLNKLRLYIELPSLPLSNHSKLPNNIKKIKWVDKIGLAIIRYIDFELGGIVLAREYGDWLNIYYETINNDEVKNVYNKLIGNVDILTKYTNGKKKYYLNIPLSFWFCKSYGSSLPLLALKKQNIKIHIKFNPIEKCIKQSPSHYFEIKENICLFEENEIISQTIDGITAKGKFIYFDVVNKKIYYDKILNDFKIPTTNNSIYKIIGEKSDFQIIPKENTVIIKDENYLYLGNPIIENTYILADYIYLDKDEQKKFKNSKLEYLIIENRFIQSQLISNHEFTYKIPFVNNVKTLFWRIILKSNFDLNDKFNYTTFPLTNKEQDIILKNKFFLNSIENTEIDDSKFYNYIQNYKSKFNIQQKGIFTYSFCLDSKKFNPSGTLNFSKLYETSLKLELNSVINYNNPCYIAIFSLQYNIFCVNDGIGGFKFYL
jgi:hypothetical protein